MTLDEMPLDDLLALRDAYRDGYVKLRSELEGDPEVDAWLVECNNRIAIAVNEEIKRRTN